MFKSLLLFCISITGLNCFAFAPLKVNIDCFLQNDIPANCEEVIQSFYALPLVTQANAVNADLIINIRVLATDQFNILKYSLKGTGNLPSFDFEDAIVKEITGNDAFVRINNSLVGLITPFVQIKNVDVTEDVVTITLKVPGGTANDTNTNQGNFYALPAVMGNLNSGQGNLNYYGQTQFDAIYAKPKYKILGAVGAAYVHAQSESTVAIPGYRSGDTYLGASITGIRTIKEGWSVALITRARSMQSTFSYTSDDPNIATELNETLDPRVLNNTSTFMEAKLGVEWILVPFQEDDSGNIAVRYIVGPEFHNYTDPETFEAINENFVHHSFVLIMSKHYKKLDVAANLRGFSKFASTDYSGVNLTLDIAYRFNQRFSVGVSGGVTYSPNRLPSPVYQDISFLTLTNGNQNAVFINGSINLRYTIGNTRLKAKDRRWVNF
jgi:hypothetical protein